MSGEWFLWPEHKRGLPDQEVGPTVGTDPWEWVRSLDTDVSDGPGAWNQEKIHLFAHQTSQI